jgi:hypothetical protein
MKAVARDDDEPLRVQARRRLVIDFPLHCCLGERRGGAFELVAAMNGAAARGTSKSLASASPEVDLPPRYPRHISVRLRSVVLLLVGAGGFVGTVAILDSCREGIAWEATTAALLTGSGSAAALAAFLLLRQRKIIAIGIFLFVAVSYGAAWLVAIEEAGVGDHCFH